MGDNAVSRRLVRGMIVAIQDAVVFLRLAKEGVEMFDPNDRESGQGGACLSDARSELANVSNAIDEAMGLIDQLLASPPTAWDDPHLD
jgi:hypothetical protein